MLTTLIEFYASRCTNFSFDVIKQGQLSIMQWTKVNQICQTWPEGGFLVTWARAKTVSPQFHWIISYCRWRSIRIRLYISDRQPPFIFTLNLAFRKNESLRFNFFSQQWFYQPCHNAQWTWQSTDYPFTLQSSPSTRTAPKHSATE